MYQAMIDDHDEIRGICSELRKLIADDGMPTALCFATSRWRLTRRLLQHIATEKAFFGPSTPDPFEERYRNHVVAWTPGRIDAEWPLYCHELQDILKTLERRMRQEEREFHDPKMRAIAMREAKKLDDDV